MKKALIYFVVVGAVLTVCAATVAAGPLDSIKGFMSEKIVGLLLAGIAGVLTLALVWVNKKTGETFGKIVDTFDELGDVFEVLAKSLEDGNMDKDELLEIVKETKDILAVWKKPKE